MDGGGAAGFGDDGELLWAIGESGDDDFGAGGGAVGLGEAAGDLGVGEFERGGGIVEPGAVKGDFMAAGREGERSEGIDVGGLADVERVGEVGVVAGVGGLDGDEVVAIGVEGVGEEGVPDEAFLGVGELAAVGIEEDEGCIEAVALARGAEIEEPMGVFGGVETEEIEIAVGGEAAKDGGGDGDGLGSVGEGVGFGFEGVGEVADAEEDGVGHAAGGDDVEGVEAVGGGIKDVDFEGNAGGGGGEDGGGDGWRGGEDSGSGMEILTKDFGGKGVTRAGALREERRGNGWAMNDGFGGE